MNLLILKGLVNFLYTILISFWSFPVQNLPKDVGCPDSELIESSGSISAACFVIKPI
jgi:hypothetical protein